MKKCPKCPEVYSDMMHFCPNDGNPLTPIVSQDPFINTVLDNKYIIEESIGKGGMGLVYRAKHVNFDRLFAIKILKNELVSDPQAIKRFRNEANAAGKIRHPNAVTISDFNITPDGLAYLVMDFVDGRSLRDILKKEGRQSCSRTTSLIGQVCDAAAAAHRKGIIHRDLKPDNIMVEAMEDEEMARVLDFGIAKFSQNPAYSENITIGGAILGSPYYMSPEQCDGRHLDNRSDIYSLGIILYELLVGKVPFRAQTPWGLVKMHCSAPPQPLRNYRGDIPPALEIAVLKALAKDPKDRQQSAIDLKRELEASLNPANNQIIIEPPSISNISPPTMEMSVENIQEFAKQHLGSPPPATPNSSTEPIPNLIDKQLNEKEALEKQKLEALAKELEAEISQMRARKDSSGTLRSAPLRNSLNTSNEAFNDLTNELSSELNQFEPKKPTSSVGYSFPNVSQNSSPSSYSTNPHNQVSSSVASSMVPVTTPHGAINPLFERSQSQRLATTFGPLDIAEEFSLALPEMVEDVLMSVSESIVIKAEILSQRAAQETVESAKSVVAEAQNRVQSLGAISPSYSNNPKNNNFNSSTQNNSFSNLGDSNRPVTRQIPGLIEQETKTSSEFKKQLFYIIGGTLLLIIILWLIGSLFK